MKRERPERAANPRSGQRPFPVCLWLVFFWSIIMDKDKVSVALQTLDAFRRELKDRSTEKKVLGFITWCEKEFGLEVKR